MIIVVGKHFVHPRFGIDAQSVVAISVPRLVMLVVACIRSIDKIEPAFRHTDVRICTSEHKFVSAQESGKLSQKSAECFVDVLVLGNFEIGYFELFVVGSVVATGGFVLIARKSVNTDVNSTATIAIIDINLIFFIKVLPSCL